MSHTMKLWYCVGGALVSSVMGGCLADPGAGADAESVLEVEVADPAHGLLATTWIGHEQIRIEARTIDGVRELSVVGGDGSSYAMWHMSIANLDTTGTYGDRTFGRYEDRETDSDTAAWAELASSHVGRVLRAVSEAADAAGDDGALDAVKDELTSVSRIYPSLVALAQPADGEVPYGPECYFGHGDHHLWSWATRYEDAGYCTFNKQAFTCAPFADCTRNYYVQIYRDYDGALLAGAGHTGGGCADAFHQGRGNGCFSWTSKHWDSLNPGGPHWRHASECCDVRIII